MRATEVIDDSDVRIYLSEYFLFVKVRIGENPLVAGMINKTLHSERGATYFVLMIEVNSTLRMTHWRPIRRTLGSVMGDESADGNTWGLYARTLGKMWSRVRSCTKYAPLDCIARISIST